MVFRLLRDVCLSPKPGDKATRVSSWPWNSRRPFKEMGIPNRLPEYNQIYSVKNVGVKYRRPYQPLAESLVAFILRISVAIACICWKMSGCTPTR